MSTDIFVFGSNLAGRHGKGSALAAKQHWGAQQGVGIGPTGNSYAIPTKDADLSVLPISIIQRHIADFIEYAKAHPEMTFHIVAIGCGLAGYKPEQIAPLFRASPPNCILPIEFLRP